MYCRFKCPITIAHRFPTSELLLCIHHDDRIATALCYNNLEVGQLQYVSHVMMASQLVTQATISREYRQHSTDIIVSYVNSTLNHGTSRYCTSNYTPDYVIACDALIYGDNVLVKIPHSLSEFFSISNHSVDECHFTHDDAVDVNTGVKRIALFKCKMILARAHLLVIMLRELVEYIILDACHSYKNYDYLTYLEL